MLASFTIKNDGQYDVKDIEIRCVHSAGSGTIIDENTQTLYEIVRRHSARNFSGVNMGFMDSQARRSGCRILSLKLVADP